jgi:hypothetical protein
VAPLAAVFPGEKMEPIQNPFGVLIDTAEGQPFSFDGFRADADRKYAPLIVNRVYTSLGRHPNSLGDYAIDGCYGRCHVERKSMEDAWSTILGWETEYETNRNLVGHRARFESELANLASIEAGVVVVEATIDQCLDLMPSRGKKTIDENRKIFFRSLISFNQRFKVHWAWMSSRRAAEVYAFRWMERFWEKLPAKERKQIIDSQQSEIPF